jgi:hypothetical protein
MTAGGNDSWGNDNWGNDNWGVPDTENVTILRVWHAAQDR